MEIKGAIFDLDGTLLDSLYVWDGIGRSYLEQKGITPKPDLDEALSTLSLRQAVQYFQKEYGTDDDFDTVLELTHQLVGDLYKNEVKAKPGVDKLLQSLASKGVRMCVATATEHQMAQDALHHNNLLSYFNSILTCTDVGAGKDQPDIFLKAQELLKTPIASTFVFEDSLYSMITAKDAGFKVAAIMDERNSDKQSEIKRVADVVLDSFYKAVDVFC